MSIVHRITGVALYFGTLLLAWWLVAAASGPEYFRFVNGLAGSWIGLIVLFGYSWALIHHARRPPPFHLGYRPRPRKPARDQLALANIVGSVALTILLWIVGLAGVVMASPRCAPRFAASSASARPMRAPMHFWRQRLTGLANLVLTIGFVILIVA